MENCYQKCEDFESEREKAQIDLRQKLSTRKISGLIYFDMVKERIYVRKETKKIERK